MRHPRWRTAAAAALLLGALGATRAEAYEQEVKKQAEELAERIQRAGRKRVAVVDFVDLEGNVTQLGRFLAEELSVTLSTLPTGLEVVDRNHLAAILKEKKLSADGLLDASAARRLGQILGVDVLVTGSLTPFGESVRVTAKALDANTAMMIAASRVAIAKVETINALASTEAAPTGARDPAHAGAPTQAGKPPAVGAPASTPAKGLPHPASAAPPRIIEQSKFAFEMKGCELAGRVATCSVSVTNRDTQRRLLKITHNSNLYDDGGNLYGVSVAAIANGEVDFTSTGHRWVQMPLHPNVPVKATVEFGSLAAGATRATALEIVGGDGHTDFTVTFNDVPFVGKLTEPNLAEMGAGVAAQPGEASGNVGSILKGAAGDTAKKLLGRFFGGKKKDPPPPQP